MMKSGDKTTDMRGELLWVLERRNVAQGLDTFWEEECSRVTASISMKAPK